jgi:integrase/recombinase XerD
MNPSHPNDLARSIHDFFSDYLPRLRGLSPHTVCSYRDTFSLLLRFAGSHRHRSVAAFDLEDIDTELILAFLEHLEDNRGNCSSTRNVRLAALHAFFRYLASRYPDRLEQCQRILAVPFKRSGSRPVEYLEYEEIEAVLVAVDRSSPEGRRDYALIATMFNTGARVQEILGLSPTDLQLIRPFHARLFGKGRKERLCPLWPQTARLLRELLVECGLDPHSPQPLFRNHHGEGLSRYGARYILAKYCKQASVSAPSLASKRLHPHSMRHSSAVHLLKAGVDLVTISHWLGHASVNTTNRYTSIDLEAKREAISKIALPDDGGSAGRSWRTDPSILEWLESL